MGASVLNSRECFHFNRAFCMQHWDSPLYAIVLSCMGHWCVAHGSWLLCCAQRCTHFWQQPKQEL